MASARPIKPNTNGLFVILYNSYPNNTSCINKAAVIIKLPEISFKKSGYFKAANGYFVLVKIYKFGNSTKILVLKNILTSIGTFFNKAN